MAFDIVQAARDDGADLILVGYPEGHTRIAEQVEYTAPCGVRFASGVSHPDTSVVNVGAGGGPHHPSAESESR